MLVQENITNSVQSARALCVLYIFPRKMLSLFIFRYNILYTIMRLKVDKDNGVFRNLILRKSFFQFAIPSFIKLQINVFTKTRITSKIKE